MISTEHINNFNISAERIEPYIHKTAVLKSSLINQIVGAEIYFKCENFQKTGSYKIRGATNAILSLTEEEKQKGVVTHSSGNFAQALSKAAESFGIPAHIVMPKNAPKVKKEGVKTYSGIIHECESTLEAREQRAKEIMDEYGATFVHPSNQIEVIYGQGTAAFELTQDQPDLDVIITPVGGGGLIAGTAIALRSLEKEIVLIGAEPFEVDDAYRSLQSGKIESNETTNTIADGLRTNLGDVNFPIIQTAVNRIIRVEEEEIIGAMRMVWERMKIIIEPSSAVTLAAVLREKENFANKKIGLIISGGNVDVADLPF